MPTSVVTAAWDGVSGTASGVFPALRSFGKPLISNFITDESRGVLRRDVRDRVEKLAPSFTSTPIRIRCWLRGGNRLCDRWLHHHRPVPLRPAGVGGPELPRKSGLRHDLNYVRNSVKATIDAFTGEVVLYFVDDSDPLVAAYSAAFDDLFTPCRRFPAELAKHLRYAEDLFRLQSEMWGAYHVGDTENFYQRASEWAVSQDPGRTGEGAANVVLVDEQGFQVGVRHRRMAPYRTMVALPDGGGLRWFGVQCRVRDYACLRAVGRGRARKELAAYMVGRSDGDRLGDLMVYRPPSSNFDGPALAEERIRNDEAVASLQTLLSQRGSSVLFGELLLVPIGNLILYVRPLYVQAEGDSTVAGTRAGHRGRGRAGGNGKLAPGGPRGVDGGVVGRPVPGHLNWVGGGHRNR
ncbi:MAG: hypothetical protein CM1200mP26_18900 [Acidimicrobiales bacterium]|nr:MAG: hypothetical protein CM1200mP26_18900 [Acidimicrobiales bacterium]